MGPENSFEVGSSNEKNFRTENRIVRLSGILGARPYPRYPRYDSVSGMRITPLQAPSAHDSEAVDPCDLHAIISRLA